MKGETAHFYRGGFLDIAGTGHGTIFVSDKSLFTLRNNGVYLETHLVVGKDAAGNESQGRVQLGNLDNNVFLLKNANITIQKQGTLEFEQSTNSDTKGGIDFGTNSPNSKIDNYGKFLRKTKDGSNKDLKIVPPVTGLGADSLFELADECGIVFVNNYLHKAGHFNRGGDKARLKGFVGDGGTMRMMGPATPGNYSTYQNDALVWNGGDIIFDTPSGVTVNLVMADTFTMNGGTLTLDSGNDVTVANSMTQTGGTISVMGSGSILSVTGAFQQSGGTSTFGGTGGRLSVAGTVTLSGSAVLTMSDGLLDATGAITIQSGTTLNGYGGTVTGDVTNAGTLNLINGSTPTLLTITGDYAQTGTLKVGLASSTVYSVLSVSGTATLGGTLDVDLLGGFTPTPGMSFAPLTYGSYSGSWTLDAPPLGFGVWHHAPGTNSYGLWVSYF